MTNVNIRSPKRSDQKRCRLVDEIALATVDFGPAYCTVQCTLPYSRRRTGAAVEQAVGERRLRVSAARVLRRVATGKFGVKNAPGAPHMSEDEKVITRGRFRGKRVTFASTE
jgi:hypothetical protein